MAGGHQPAKQSTPKSALQQSEVHLVSDPPDASSRVVDMGAWMLCTTVQQELLPSSREEQEASWRTVALLGAPIAKKPRERNGNAVFPFH